MTGPEPPLPPNRSYDGTANNPGHPRRGAAGEPFLRLLSAAYANGASRPAGPDRPNPRLVSDTVGKQGWPARSRRGLSDLAAVWTLFLSHTLQRSRPAEPEEPFGVPVPDGDSVFPPGSTIPLARADYDVSTGGSADDPRRQLNHTSSYLDASAVYGTDPTRAAALRAFAQGKLRTGEGGLLPPNTSGLPNRPPGPDFFLAGDDRANTHVGLCALHPLFVREHNRLAGEIASADPGLGDEAVYQQARKLVGALV